MNVPQLRFKGFNKEWQRKQVKEILDYEQPTKYIVTSTEYSDNYSIPVLTANKSFILGYTNETEGIYNKKCIIFDDFTQESKYVDFPFKVKSSAIKILSTKSNDDLYFIFNLLQVTPLIDEGHRRYYIDIVQKQKLLIPCIKEQQKIGTFFSKLDDLITKQTQKVALLKQLKRGYLQKLFPQAGQTTPQLRFKGFNDEWQINKLGNILQFKTFSKPNINDNGKYLIMDMGSVNSDGQIIANKKTNQIDNLLKIDDLVMPKDDIGGGFIIGKTAYISKNDTYVAGDHVYIIKTNNNSLFVHYLINQSGVRRFILSKVTGSAQLGLLSKNMINIKICLPLVKEQQKIGSLFAKLDHLIELQNRKLALLKELKKGYLQKMFI